MYFIFNKPNFEVSCMPNKGSLRNREAYVKDFLSRVIGLCSTKSPGTEWSGAKPFQLFIFKVKRQDTGLAFNW